MDQIANLVIDLSIDSAEFRNEVPRIKKLLNDAAGDSERSAARMQRFLDKQTEATRRTSASLEQVTASSTAYSSAVEKSGTVRVWRRMWIRRDSGWRHWEGNCVRNRRSQRLWRQHRTGQVLLFTARLTV